MRGSSWQRSSARRRCCSSRRCPRTRAASCSNASCGSALPRTTGAEPAAPLRRLRRRLHRVTGCAGYHRRMKHLPVVVRRGAVAALLVAAAVPAAAQSAITLYGGARASNGLEQATTPSAAADLRSSGALSMAFDWPYDSSRQLQLFLSHQSTRLALASSTTPGTPGEVPMRLQYLHLGGTNYFDGPVGRGPYVVGGLGI